MPAAIRSPLARDSIHRHTKENWAAARRADRTRRGRRKAASSSRAPSGENGHGDTETRGRGEYSAPASFCFPHVSASQCLRFSFFLLRQLFQYFLLGLFDRHSIALTVLIDGSVLQDVIPLIAHHSDLPHRIFRNRGPTGDGRRQRSGRLWPCCGTLFKIR